MANEIENRGPQLFAVNVFFIIIAVATTLLRCYVRLFIVKSWGRDDWFMVAATVSDTEQNTNTVVLTTPGSDCLYSLWIVLDSGRS
jgi:hypothetical protein